MTTAERNLLLILAAAYGPRTSTWFQIRELMLRIGSEAAEDARKGDANG